MNAKKAIRNIFSKGLNRDIDKHQLQNQNIYWNENFRLVTQEGESNTLLENVKGNVNLKDINDVNMQGTYEKIIGHYVFDNKDIILFSVTTDSVDKYPSCSAIDLYKYNTVSNKYANRITLYNEFHTNNLFGHLRLRDDITVIGRNETNFIRKIYWTDNNNVLRYANIAPDVDPVTGKPYDGFLTSDYITLTTQPATKFDFLQLIDNSDIIIITDITSGELLSGMVAYTYRFFNENGSISNIGQTTPLYPVISANIFQSSLEIKGDDININTKKGFRGQIDLNLINQQYDYIQFIGLYYHSNNSVPIVKVIDEQKINGDATLIFEDNGRDYIDSMTYEEFRLIKNNYIVKTLERKDDRLFIGNLQEEYFDVDFDARAYRFADDGTGYIRASIYESNLVSYMNITSSNWDTVLYDHDCINKWKNILTNDEYVRLHPEFNFKYQSDGITLGGEGPNIEYHFNITENLIDTQLLSGDTFKVSFTGKPLDFNDSDMAYYLGINKGFQRDEIYRFGIVFFDNKGRQSFVKWIGDVRMPTIDEYDLESISGNNLYARVLNLYIKIKNLSTLPTNLDGSYMNYQFVYVERTLKDRTVIAAGIDAALYKISKTFTTTIKNFYQLNEQLDDIYDDGEPADYTAYLNNIREFISPDLEYNNFYILDMFIQRVGGYIRHSDIYTYYKEYGHSDISLTGNPVNDKLLTSYKLTTVNDVNFGNYKRFNISNSLEVQGLENNYTFGWSDNIDTTIYTNTKLYTIDTTYDLIIPRILPLYEPYYPDLDSANRRKIPFSSVLKSFIYKHDSDRSPKDIPTTNYSYIRRNIQGYGGYMYENRLTNKYIPISDIVKPSTVSKKCLYGDTYLNFYDKTRGTITRCLRGEGLSFKKTFGSILDTINPNHYHYSNIDDAPGTEQTQGVTQAVYSIVETSIVTPLIHGVQMHKEFNDINYRLIGLKNNSKKITEGHGEKNSDPLTGHYGENPVSVILDYPDMYLYNSVYSKMNDSKQFFVKPQTWTKLVHFPTRIRWSDIKFNGELMDNWLLFRPNNMQDVDTKYGQIEQIVNWKNYLFAFQYRGFCVLPVNEKATTSTSVGTPVILGEGLVLSKVLNYAQGSEKYGLQNNNQVLTTENAIYWLDVIERKWLTFSNKSMELNFIKGMSSWLRDNIDEDTTYSAGYDNQFKEVLFSWNEQTLVFSELLGAFQGVYTFNTERFIHIPELLSTKQQGKNDERIFIHNVGDRTEWYWVGCPSIVELIITDQSGVTKEFNTIEYMSESFTEDTHIDNYQDTLNTIQSFNDFLETDEIELLPYLKGDTLYTGGLQIPLSAPSTVKNIRRRERMWRTMVPRVNSENILIDNYRMRDGYNRLRLTYNNEDNFQFILHPVTTYYTLSNLE